MPRSVGWLPEPDQWRWELQVRDLTAKEFAVKAQVSLPTVLRVLRGQAIMRSSRRRLEQALNDNPPIPALERLTQKAS